MQAPSTPTNTPRDERAPSSGPPSSDLPSGGSGGGEGGGDQSAKGSRSSADAPNAEQPQPNQTVAQPRRLFSDVEPPKKDTAEGVGAPNAGTEPPKDTGKQQAEAASGDVGTMAGGSEGVAQPPLAIVGAHGAPNESSVDTPPHSADEREPISESNASSSEAVAPTTPSDIELPEFEVELLEGDAGLLERAHGSTGRASLPITGIWEQIEGPSDADFGPGGYSRSVLMLNPALHSAAIYRVFRGDITLVQGGEFALDCAVSNTDASAGSLCIRRDPSLNSRFSSDPLPLGGTPRVVVLPPDAAESWTIAWKRDARELVVGSKRYAAITRDAFESLRRGGGDVATDADRADRVPTRAKGGTIIEQHETSFFGVKGGGKRVCFIVDISGSMQGPKLDRLKLELTASISNLDAKTDFSVVFFDGTAHVIDQAWMKGDADKNRTIQLIAQQGTGGGTDPTEAFRFAFANLNPTPDCIFFMTDGQIPPQTAQLLSTLNTGTHPTVIHSIAFGEVQAETLMKEIAQKNGGTYLFVAP